MTIFDNVFMVIPLSVLAALIFFGYMWLKLDNATRNQLIIAAAIYLYKKDRLEQNDLAHIDDVQFDDMEEFKSTVFRMTDWGLKRILPKEKYKLVKPFISRAKKYRKLARTEVENIARDIERIK